MIERCPSCQVFMDFDPFITKCSLDPRVITCRSCFSKFFVVYNELNDYTYLEEVDSNFYFLDSEEDIEEEFST